MKTYLLSLLTTVGFMVALGGSAKADPIVNGGFETGSLSPWFQDQTLCFNKCDNWNVTSLDSKSGGFSATDVGDNSLRQNFDPVLTALITEVSLWVKHPDGGIIPTGGDFFYADGTSSSFFVLTRDTNWEFFDITSQLQTGKALNGLDLFGFSGGPPSGSERTFIDDVMIKAPTAVPEPPGWLLLAATMLAFKIVKRTDPNVSFHAGNTGH